MLINIAISIYLYIHIYEQESVWERVYVVYKEYKQRVSTHFAKDLRTAPNTSTKDQFGLYAKWYIKMKINLMVCKCTNMKKIRNWKDDFIVKLFANI